VYFGEKEMKRNQDTIRMVRMYGAWALQKEEEWLNSMADKGWLLTDITFLVYRFRHIESGGNWIYQLDYNSLSGEELEEYKQIFHDAGWEYVTNFVSWHYFRANADEVKAKTIHTNNESRIKVLWRVMSLLLIVSFPSYIWLMTAGRHLQTFTGSDTFTLMEGVMIFIIVLIIFLAYAVLRMFLEILRLKREGKE
jgi:hypothetical protein